MAETTNAERVAMWQDEAARYSALAATATGDAAEGYRIMARDAALFAKAFAALDDAERVDWYEQQHTLHRAVEVLYVVDGYKLCLTYDGDTVQEYYAPTLRAAIDRARKGEG